ncbi:MAG: sigma-70 family RNA polymerase sigma factor [Gemmatimonadaceae bacterium]
MQSDLNSFDSLVEHMACGDERAAATLFDEFSPVLFALAFRIVGERADAEEVVLDAFTQAWKNAAFYRSDRSSVLSWLSMITRTRALDFIRARTRRARTLSNASRQMADEPIAIGNGTRGASDRLEEEERAVAVGAALHSLAAPQRLAIELSFFSGLTHLEIAERLGEPLGTVKTRIRLGVQHMRNRLGDFTSVGQVSMSRANYAG